MQTYDYFQYKKEKKCSPGENKSKNENFKDLSYQRKRDAFQFHMTHLGDNGGGAYILGFTLMVGQLPKRSSHQGAPMSTYPFTEVGNC